VLIFHHPEFCLHPYEKALIKGVEFSGLFHDIGSKCDVLFCGHTHPASIQTNWKEKYWQLHNFIGGAAHLRPTKRARPLFYYYEYDRPQSPQSITQHTYVINLIPEEQAAEAEFVFSIGKETYEISHSGGQPVPLSGFSAVKGNIKRSKAEGNAEINRLKDIEKSHRLTLENEIKSKLERLTTDSFESIRNYHFSKYKTNSHTYSQQIDLKSSRVSIGLDIMFTDQLYYGPEREVLGQMVRSKFDESKKDKGLIYYPIFLDVLFFQMEDEYKESYKKMIEEAVKDFFNAASMINPQDINSGKLDIGLVKTELFEFYPESKSNLDILLPVHLRIIGAQAES
jgi:hypothetical protein